MKTLGIIILLLFGLIQVVYTQYYEATNNVKTLSLSVSPWASLRAKDNPWNFSNASLQLGKLWRKGIYYSAGYTYHRSNAQTVPSRITNYDVPSFQDAHSAYVAIELKKLLFSTGGTTKSTLRCFYKNIGVSISPEYQYMFPIKGLDNKSDGEFSLRTGLYYHQGHTKINRRSNLMFTAYYKKAFTPILKLETPVGSKSYYYDEVGVRITLLLKEIYRFDHFGRK